MSDKSKAEQNPLGILLEQVLQSLFVVGGSCMNGQSLNLISLFLCEDNKVEQAANYANNFHYKSLF